MLTVLMSSAHMHTEIFGAEHLDSSVTPKVCRCHILISSKEKMAHFFRLREDLNGETLCVVAGASINLSRALENCCALALWQRVAEIAAAH